MEREPALSDLGEMRAVYDAYRRILARPEVQKLAVQFGLGAKVRYEFVGERQSFNGKATTTEGQQLVRLPCNPRPDPYLLLTVLHEWAHLVVHRQNRKRRTAPHGPETCDPI